MTCSVCDGTGWVCENCGTKWELDDGSTCCGAGEPCICNPFVEIEFDHISASVSDDEITILH